MGIRYNIHTGNIETDSKVMVVKNNNDGSVRISEGKAAGKRDEKLKSKPTGRLNDKMREAGVAEGAASSGDPTQDALDAAIMLVSLNVPLHSMSGNYYESREEVRVLFAVRSHLAIRNAVADNRKYFKKESKYQGAQLLLTTAGKRRMSTLRRGKATKKAVKAAEVQLA